VAAERSRHDLRAWGALVINVLLWASGFAGIRVGLTAYAPGQLILLRFLVASATLGIYALATRMPLPAWRDLPTLALAGLTGVILYHTFLTYGEQTVPSGTASFLVALSPVFTALLAVAFLGERLRPVGWLAIAVSLVGAALIALSSGEFGLEPGALLVLGAAVATAFYNILLKTSLRRYSAMQATAVAFWLGTLGLLVFLPGLPRAVARAPLGVTGAIVYLGVFPAAIAYLMWSYLLSRLPASLVGGFIYLIPPLATAIGWAWLGEAPSPLSLVGGVVSLAGVILLNRFGRVSDRSGA
jgi:drug/metabolite transporter (DMT)-like permease